MSVDVHGADCSGGRHHLSGKRVPTAFPSRATSEGKATRRTPTVATEQRQATLVQQRRRPDGAWYPPPPPEATTCVAASRLLHRRRASDATRRRLRGIAGVDRIYLTRTTTSSTSPTEAFGTTRTARDQLRTSTRQLRAPTGSGSRTTNAVSRAVTRSTPAAGKLTDTHDARVRGADESQGTADRNGSSMAIVSSSRAMESSPSVTTETPRQCLARR